MVSLKSKLSIIKIVMQYNSIPLWKYKYIYYKLHTLETLFSVADHYFNA